MYLQGLGETHDNQERFGRSWLLVHSLSGPMLWWRFRSYVLVFLSALTVNYFNLTPQDELVGFVRAYGGKIADKPLGSCEMISLSPDGFKVQAALLPHDPVPISFSKECESAQDFQKQILQISQQAMMFA